MPEVGTTHKKEETVTFENSAKAVGSGLLEVFATPSMIALMEACCHESISDQLEEGYGSVGMFLNVRHLSATPIGMKVYCESKLIKVEGKKLTFEVRAFDETGLIGEGIHERYIVHNEKFQKKAYAKLQSDWFMH